MARMRVFIVLVLAVTVGGVFAFATYNYVQKAPGKTVTVPTRPVVVAAADVDTIDWPATSVPADAIGSVNDVVGRGLIVPVVANEPILPTKLASKEAGA